MNVFKRMFEDTRKADEKAYMDRVSDTIKHLHKEGERNITTAAYSMMCLNTYERLLVYGLLDDEAYLRVVRYCIEQAGEEFKQYREFSLPTPVGYNHMLKCVHIHGLIERLEKASTIVSKLLEMLPDDKMLEDCE